MNLKFVKKVMATGLVLPLLATGLSVQAEETIKIGGNFELSGAAASYGTPMSKGVRLAIKQANEAGGVLGKQLEYIEYDNRSDLTETVSVAKRLVGEGVVGVVGPAPSGNVLAQMPVLEEAQVPSVAPAATLDGITYNDRGELYKYFFRVAFEDSYQGSLAGQYAANQLQAKRAALVSDQAVDSSLGLADAFKESFTEAGGEVVYTDSIQSGDTDFTATISSLLSQDFDVLYLPLYYNEAGLFIKQARELGLTQPIIGGDGFHSPTLIDLASPQYATDVYFTSHFSTTSDVEAVQTFVKDYQEEYGEEPDTFSATAYDAARLLLDAIERAGEAEPTSIKAALEATQDFEGVTGVFSVDEHHNPVKAALMIKLENGTIASTEYVEAE